MPDANSAEIMLFVDSLPKKWRALVYEYGFKNVMALYQADMKLSDADDALWMMRSAAQEKLMATDYITRIRRLSERKRERSYE
jgi:hypothetical protein